MPLHHVILPNVLLCSYELNTLDACWIAVDVWSNSSRCRIVSVYLSRTSCLYTWSCLDILITMRFSINCSTVICSPTVEFAILREATSETYGPRVYLPSYYFPMNLLFLSLFILQSLFCNLYNKNTKNIYLIISIRPHFCMWPRRDWQPLYRVGCKVLVCLCRYEGLVCSLLLDWYLGSQKLSEILTLLCCIILSSSGKTNATSRRSRI